MFSISYLFQILIRKVQMLYFKDDFWYDISVDRGVKYFPRSIACWKYTIYSAQ